MVYGILDQLALVALRVHSIAMKLDKMKLWAMLTVNAMRVELLEVKLV